MRKSIRKTFRTRRERSERGHRFEHWYVDNQVYFITARCRDRTLAFASEWAKQIFWDKLEQYAAQADFKLIIVSLIDNHYHLLAYCKSGAKLQTMMRQFHGSVAKLVNDVLIGAARLSGPRHRSGRLLPFSGPTSGANPSLTAASAMSSNFVVPIAMLFVSLSAIKSALITATIPTHVFTSNSIAH